MDMIDFQLRTMFSPHENARRQALFESERRLIHYTSAENAVKIMRNGEIWLRNVRVMNDYMEIDHGFNLITRALQPQADSSIEIGMEAVKKALNEAHPNIVDETLHRFSQWWNAIKYQTYVTCLSEHHEDEDMIGRLSMWRNYTAGQAGVGLVIDPTPLYSMSQEFGAFSSPVFYFGDEHLNKMLLEISKVLQQQTAFLKSVSREQVLGNFFLLLRSISHCSKHPGFKEEEEWRIMHTIGMDPPGALRLEVETIRGIPQRVIKLKLEDTPQFGLTGISIPALLQRVIIGPTQYQAAVGSALLDIMNAANVPDAINKIVYSNIPIRTEA